MSCYGFNLLCVDLRESQHILSVKCFQNDKIKGRNVRVSSGLNWLILVLNKWFSKNIYETCPRGKVQAWISVPVWPLPLLLLWQPDSLFFAPVDPLVAVSLPGYWENKAVFWLFGFFPCGINQSAYRKPITEQTVSMICGYDTEVWIHLDMSCCYLNMMNRTEQATWQMMQRRKQRDRL